MRPDNITIIFSRFQYKIGFYLLFTMRKFLLSLLVVLCSLPARAFEYHDYYYDYESGHIVYYKVLTWMNKTCAISGISDNNKGSGELVIPEWIDGCRVVAFDHEAFKGCTTIKSLSIPLSVNFIGQYAFADCTNLEKIDIECDGYEYYIGSCAFSNCSALKEIELPGIPAINSHLFEGCTSLTSVKIFNTVKSIQEYAFVRCTSLKDITIPQSVEFLGNFAFSNCTSLEQITIPQSVKTVNYGAFFGCSALTSVNLPHTITKIPASAFERCSGLASITIPNSVTEIGRDAFKECTNLKNMIFEDGDEPLACPEGLGYCGENLYIGRNIQPNTFASKAEIKSITVGGPISAIADSAFFKCYGLAEVTLSDKVKSIGKDAFSRCNALTLVTLPRVCYRNW